MTACMYAWLHDCMRVRMLAWTHACMPAYMHTCMMDACMHGCMHRSMHVCLPKCMHTNQTMQLRSRPRKKQIWVQTYSLHTLNEQPAQHRDTYTWKRCLFFMHFLKHIQSRVNPYVFPSSSDTMSMPMPISKSSVTTQEMSSLVAAYKICLLMPEKICLLLQQNTCLLCQQKT